jgi:hypothetical protein
MIKDISDWSVRVMKVRLTRGLVKYCTVRRLDVSMR